MQSSLDKETIEYVINTLRRGTITWEGRTKCLNRGRRKRPTGEFFKNGKEKTLWERDCDLCGEWILLKDDLLQVDHIDEVGPFKGDWNLFIPRMYCSQDNLQALCFSCHAKKTSAFNASLRFERKSSKVARPERLERAEDLL